MMTNDTMLNIKIADCGVFRFIILERSSLVELLQHDIDSIPVSHYDPAYVPSYELVSYLDTVKPDWKHAWLRAVISEVKERKMYVGSNIDPMPVVICYCSTVRPLAITDRSTMESAKYGITLFHDSVSNVVYCRDYMNDKTYPGKEINGYIFKEKSDVQTFMDVFVYILGELDDVVIERVPGIPYIRIACAIKSVSVDILNLCHRLYEFYIVWAADVENVKIRKEYAECTFKETQEIYSIDDKSDSLFDLDETVSNLERALKIFVSMKPKLDELDDKREIEHRKLMKFANSLIL